MFKAIYYLEPEYSAISYISTVLTSHFFAVSRKLEALSHLNLVYITICVIQKQQWLWLGRYLVADQGIGVDIMEDAATAVIEKRKILYCISRMTRPSRSDFHKSPIDVSLIRLPSVWKRSKDG